MAWGIRDVGHSRLGFISPSRMSPTCSYRIHPPNHSMRPTSLEAPVPASSTMTSQNLSSLISSLSLPTSINSTNHLLSSFFQSTPRFHKNAPRLSNSKIMPWRGPGQGRLCPHRGRRSSLPIPLSRGDCRQPPPRCRSPVVYFDGALLPG